MPGVCACCWKDCPWLQNTTFVDNGELPDGEQIATKRAGAVALGSSASVEFLVPFSPLHCCVVIFSRWSLLILDIFRTLSSSATLLDMRLAHSSRTALRTRKFAYLWWYVGSFVGVTLECAHCFCWLFPALPFHREQLWSRNDHWLGGCAQPSRSLSHCACSSCTR